METEFARTFLTIIQAGNFINAAAALHVTQSTVSARIRALEQQLGCRLFVRNKAGTTLTPAGREFQKHATRLLQALARARQAVGASGSFRGVLNIGARFGLWDGLLTRWLGWMRTHAADIAVRAEIGFEEDLMQKLVEGGLDIGIMYTPQSRPTLVVEWLLDEELVLVEGGPVEDPCAPERYVHVDWGPEFYSQHATHFPDLHPASLVVGIGWLGLQHILGAGGAGYFPQRLVDRHLQAGTLRRVSDAPGFKLPAYLVYAQEHEQRLIAPALRGIRELVTTTR